MLDFLHRTGSYLTVNAYSFFAYIEQPDNITLDYALGNYKPGVRDPMTGLVYHSLLDAQLDATYFAMEKLGSASAKEKKFSVADRWELVYYRDWVAFRRGTQIREARDGAPAASVANAQAYNNCLINRMLSGDTGTPHRPNADMDMYIFALFNDREREGFLGPDDIEQHFGLFYPNKTKVYGFDFHGGDAPTESWCVANASAGDARLQAALDYACGHGADCSAIQPGAACFEPNTVAAHASYAFNSYYQRSGRAKGTCDFDGDAFVVYDQPKIGNCVLPSKALIQETTAKSEGYDADVPVCLV